MPHPLRLLFFSLCSAWFVGIGQISAQDLRNLTPQIDALIEAPAYADAWWGIDIINLQTQEVLYQRNPEVNFIPASNVKLFTTAAVLDQKGVGFRFATTLIATGIVQNDTLKGDLIIRGGGDPTIGKTRYPRDPTQLFKQWADSLKAAGIRHIEGDLIGDDNRYSDTHLGHEWSWSDLRYYYAPEISALSFNDNVVDFTIQARQQGQAGLVSWRPSTSYVEVENQTQTGPPNSRLEEGYDRPLGTNLIRLSSIVPQESTDRESLSVSNPTLYFCHVLKETFLNEGLTISGAPLDIDDLPIDRIPEDSLLVAQYVHASPPLGELVQLANKDSHNLVAELLLWSIGTEIEAKPSPLTQPSDQRGLNAAKHTYAEAGIDTSRLYLVDGSGLSRHNLVTPSMTTALLSYMWRHPSESIRDGFFSSLSVGGVDGTLRRRFQRGPAHRKVRAKTGSMSYVVTISGYVTTQDGTPLAFAFYCNNFSVPNRIVRQTQDQIIAILADL